MSEACYFSVLKTNISPPSITKNMPSQKHAVSFALVAHSKIRITGRGCDYKSNRNTRSNCEAMAKDRLRDIERDEYGLILIIHHEGLVSMPEMSAYVLRH